MSRSTSKTEIMGWIVDWLSCSSEVAPEAVCPDEDLVSFGLSSLRMVELSGQIGDRLGVDVDPTVAWEYPTARELSQELARCAADGGATA